MKYLFPPLVDWFLLSHIFVWINSSNEVVLYTDLNGVLVIFACAQHSQLLVLNLKLVLETNLWKIILSIVLLSICPNL